MRRSYSYNRSRRNYSGSRNSGYHGYCGCHRGYGLRSSEDVIALLILAVIAMPIAGLYFLISGKDPSKKVIGGILLVIGIIFWVYCGIN